MSNIPILPPLLKEREKEHQDWLKGSWVHACVYRKLMCTYLNAFKILVISQKDLRHPLDNTIQKK